MVFCCHTIIETPICKAPLQTKTGGKNTIGKFKIGENQNRKIKIWENQNRGKPNKRKINGGNFF